MPVYAARYARAFADVVSGAGISAEAIDRQLGDFRAALADSRELREALSNPSIAVEARIRVIDALVPRLHLSRETRNFLAVLIRHERMSAFDEILTDFRAEMDRRQGVSEAAISTARRLGPEERQQMEERVMQLAGGKVRTRFDEDSSLIGGVVVKIGSTVYDGSVRGRLARLKDELVAG